MHPSPYNIILGMLICATPLFAFFFSFFFGGGNVWFGSIICVDAANVALDSDEKEIIYIAERMGDLARSCK